MMTDRSRLYYEGHVTIEPVSGDKLINLIEVAAEFEMRISTFYLAKPDSPVPDAFISVRDESYASIAMRLQKACEELNRRGLIIKRVKIEDTLFDTKHGDRLLGVQLFDPKVRDQEISKL
jgi:hypothetical protein